MMKTLLRWYVFLTLATVSAFSQSSFWVPTAGPLRISVSALAMNSQGDVFAGTYTRGIYRSTDNGASWAQINVGLPLSRVYAIAVSRSFRNHDYIFAATLGTGIYRSTNNGASWQQVGFADTTITIESIAIDANGVVYASAHKHWDNVSTMYRSDNNGFSWQNIELDNPLVHTNVPFILTPTRGKLAGQVFAGTNWGVYRTLNQGDTWERVVPVGSNFKVNSFAVNFRGDMYSAATDSAVYKSTDDGQSWFKVGVTNDKVLSLAITPNGVLFAATYGKGMYRSLDDGASWHSLGSGLDNELMLSLVYAEAGEKSTYIYAGGTGLGTYITRNSTTPFALNRYDILYPDVKVGSNRTDSILVTNMDTTALTISSATTTHEYYSVTPEETTLAIGESAWFHVTFAPEWYGNFDAKVEFRSSANSSPDEVLLFGIGRAPDTRILFTDKLSYGRVLLGHYSELSTRLKNIGNDTLNISSLITSDSVFTAWADNYNVLPGDFATITVRFTPRYHGPYTGFTVIYSNSVSEPDTVYMNGFGRGYPVPYFNVSHIDFGNIKVGSRRDTTFTLRNMGEDTLWVYNIESSNNQFSVLFDNSPLPPNETRSFRVTYSPFAKGEIYGTIYFHSNALSSPDSITVHGLGDPTSDIETLPGKPTEYVIYQNYPNPFNNSTTVRFAIAEESAVKITIYNQLGIEVGMLVNEVLPQGYYETTWRDPNQPSGVYYYRFHVKTIVNSTDENADTSVLTLFDEMKKMLFVK